jgi:hypothetical protein
VTQTPHRQTGRMTAILGVATVAATAAVISFSHVQALARTAGEPELTAWLLPLSIDGAIAAAAAVVLADSKAGRRTTFLTWLMLALGLAASLAANIASAQPTWTARAVAAWPPIALALGIEVLASMSRRSGPVAPARPVPPETATSEQTEPSQASSLASSRSVSTSTSPPAPLPASGPSTTTPPPAKPARPARRRASSCTWSTSRPRPSHPARPRNEPRTTTPSRSSAAWTRPPAGKPHAGPSRTSWAAEPHGQPDWQPLPGPMPGPGRWANDRPDRVLAGSCPHTR